MILTQDKLMLGHLCILVSPVIVHFLLELLPGIDENSSLFLERCHFFDLLDDVCSLEIRFGFLLLLWFTRLFVDYGRSCLWLIFLLLAFRLMTPRCCFILLSSIMKYPRFLRRRYRAWYLKRRHFFHELYHTPKGKLSICLLWEADLGSFIGQRCLRLLRYLSLPFNSWNIQLALIDLETLHSKRYCCLFHVLINYLNRYFFLASNLPYIKLFIEMKLRRNLKVVKLKVLHGSHCFWKVNDIVSVCIRCCLVKHSAHLISEYKVLHSFGKVIFLIRS